MTTLDIVKSALEDELSKIAGSLQGHVRSGRKPIGVEKLIDKENKLEKDAIITKLSGWRKGALTAAGGVALYETARRANEDRKLGKIVRLQQGQ